MIPIYIAVAIFTLVGYFFLIPRYGMWAAAWLTVFSEAAICISSIAMTRSANRFSVFIRSTLVALAASLIMGSVVWALRSTHLVLPILAGGTVYALALFALGGVSKKTLQETLSLQKANNETSIL